MNLARATGQQFGNILPVALVQKRSFCSRFRRRRNSIGWLCGNRPVGRTVVVSMSESHNLRASMVSEPRPFRTESDSMGDMQVPADAYYGAQTARAVENFPISGLRFQRPFIWALGLIKK